MAKKQKIEPEKAITQSDLPFEPLSKLDALMYREGITQMDLVRRIDEMFDPPIKQYMLSRIQTGKQENFHTDTLIKICLALDVTPNDILAWQERGEELKRKS